MKRSILFFTLVLTILLAGIIFLSLPDQPAPQETRDVSQSAATSSTATVSTTEQMVIEPDPGVAYTTYTIFGADEAVNGYRVMARARMMYNGQMAIDAAVKETGCSRERIFDGDCAPSLNNNFYLGEEDASVKKFFLPANASVELYRDGKLESATAETLFNLITQTDAFVSEAGRTPFLFELDGTTIMRVTQQYLP